MATVEKAIGIARRKSVKVILDPAPYAAIPDSRLADIDFLTPTMSELGLMTNTEFPKESKMEEMISAARSLCQRGAHCVIAKLGSLGAVLVTPNKQGHWPARLV